MKQNRKSTKANLFFVGLMALGLLSSCGGSEPSYSAPQESYDSSSQQYSSGGNSAELVGYWRYQEIIGEGEFAITTAYYLVVNADGTFSYYSQDSNDTISDYTEGTWSVANSTLNLNYANGSSENLPYLIYQGDLIFNENYSRVWESHIP